jgi:hypothetical protein
MKLPKLSADVQDAMEQLRDVERVSAVQRANPDGAKGLGQDIAAFLLEIPPGMISGVFEIIKTVLSRPGQPPAKVKVTATSVEVEFIPGRTTLDEMAQFIERIRPQTTAP